MSGCRDVGRGVDVDGQVLCYCENLEYSATPLSPLDLSATFLDDSILTQFASAPSKKSGKVGVEIPSFSGEH